MAIKQRIKVSGYIHNCFNVSSTVGVGGINAPGDVILVQAMFNYIAEGNGTASVPRSAPDLPKVTGTLKDNTLLQFIKKFQLANSGLLLATDGVIHPAHYSTEDYSSGFPGKRMTITLMHEFCEDAAARMGQVDYTTDMLRKFNFLKGFVMGL